MTKNLVTWGCLVLLTLFSVALNDNVLKPEWVIWLAMATVVLKGKQIVDIYMEMVNAPIKWRLLIQSFIVIIPLVLAVIYTW